MSTLGQVPALARVLAERHALAAGEREEVADLDADAVITAVGSRRERPPA